jgi:hypothetical protein
MPVRIIPMPMIAAGDDTFAFNAGDMVMIDGVIPYDARVKADGTFTNCTYSSPLIHVANPGSGTQVFSFEIEYKLTDLDGWTSGAGSALQCTAYHSLGHTDITTTLIETALSESTHAVSALCSSNHVNPYSKHRPNGSAPYRMGDFRLYTHDMPGGVGFNKEVYVENAMGSGVYVVTTADIPWLFHYKILGYLATTWVPITGTYFDFIKIEVNGELTAAYSPAIGGHGMLGWSAVLTNNDAGGATPNYHVKNFYCDTIAGVYVEGQTLEVDIVHAAKPYSLGSLTFSRTTANRVARVSGTLSGYAHVHEIRLQAKDSLGSIFAGTIDPGSDGAFDVDTTESGSTFDANYPYKVDIDYDNTGFYVTEATNGNQVGFS